MRFVDSNIFVYHLADDPFYGKRAGDILSTIEKGEKAATSTLVIAQVCAYLKWKKLERAIPMFIDLLRSLPSLSKEDTTFLDVVSAYALQEETKAGWQMWDDLIIASQMSRLGIKEIYSNDRDFDTIRWVKRVF
ncbi:MAG: type II toxin-antitoxin system VapC family toxin [Euryarchaeota archaeon]|nr:type II toxin-antitoxin system VapC family toxin [Euryarchaeota archaeon]